MRDAPERGAIRYSVHLPDHFLVWWKVNIFLLSSIGQVLRTHRIGAIVILDAYFAFTADNPTVNDHSYKMTCDICSFSEYPPLPL